MKPKMPVILEVGNVYSKIDGILTKRIIQKLDQNLSYFVQNYYFSYAYRHGYWDYRERKYKKWDGKNHLLKNKRFLSGLVDRVKIILKNTNTSYIVKDIRKPVPFGPEISLKNIEKREYQQRILHSALANKSGIIQSATGSGKSIVIAQIIANTNVKTMVYVTGIDLLYQMYQMFNNILGEKVGIIGDGKAEIRRINICTVWTASNALGKKYEPFDDEDFSTNEKFDKKSAEKIKKAITSAECCFYDECHMLATSTLQLINQKSRAARYKFGLSGTAWRDDNADLLLEAVCGKKVAEISASELIHSGFLVKPKIHFINIPEKGNLPDSYQAIYKKYIVKNKIRNDKIISSACKLVKGGRKVLVLVKTIEHGKILLSKFPSNLVIYFVRGEMASEERNRVRKEFLEGKIDIIIASIVYDQGIDLVNLDSLILAGSGKATGRTLQRLGRVIRPFDGKKDAIVIDFIDNAKYLKEHSKKRLEIYKREAGFEVILPKNVDGLDKGAAKTMKKNIGKVSW